MMKGKSLRPQRCLIPANELVIQGVLVALLRKAA
jgi:hypothetical protein